MKSYYAVRDKLAGFLPLFTVPNDDVAIRSFMAALADVSSDFYKNPEDYSLWSILQFNTETGDVEYRYHELANGSEVDDNVV